MTFTAGQDKAGGGFRKVIGNLQVGRTGAVPGIQRHASGDMDLDGVKMEVLYPSMARNFYSLKGDEIPLQKAGLVAYNDWMRDYCAAAPKRPRRIRACSPHWMLTGRWQR